MILAALIKLLISPKCRGKSMLCSAVLVGFYKWIVYKDSGKTGRGIKPKYIHVCTFYSEYFDEADIFSSIFLFNSQQITPKYFIRVFRFFDCLVC